MDVVVSDSINTWILLSLWSVCNGEGLPSLVKPSTTSPSESRSSLTGTFSPTVSPINTPSASPPQNTDTRGTSSTILEITETQPSQAIVGAQPSPAIVGALVGVAAVLIALLKIGGAVILGFFLGNKNKHDREEVHQLQDVMMERNNTSYTGASNASPPFMGEYSEVEKEEPFDIYTEVDENDDDDTPKKPSTSGSSSLQLLSSLTLKLLLMPKRSRDGNRITLEKPKYCPQEVYDIMLMCWKEDPKERASFDELLLSIK